MSHLTIEDLKKFGLKLTKEAAQELHSIISRIAQHGDQGDNVAIEPANVKAEGRAADEDAARQAKVPSKKVKATEPEAEAQKSEDAPQAPAEEVK